MAFGNHFQGCVGRIATLHASIADIDLSPYRIVFVKASSSLRGLVLPRNDVSVFCLNEISPSELHRLFLTPIDILFQTQSGRIFGYEKTCRPNDTQIEHIFQKDVFVQGSHQHSYLYQGVFLLSYTKDAELIKEFLRVEINEFEHQVSTKRSVRRQCRNNFLQAELAISDYREIRDAYFEVQIGKYVLDDNVLQVYSKVVCTCIPVTHTFLVEVTGEYDSESDVPSHIPAINIMEFSRKEKPFVTLKMTLPFSYLWQLPPEIVHKSSHVLVEIDKVYDAYVTFKVASGVFSIGCEVFIVGGRNIRLFNNNVAELGYVFGDFIFYHSRCESFPINFKITTFLNPFLGRSLRIKRDEGLKQWGLFYVGSQTLVSGDIITCFSGKQMRKDDWLQACTSDATFEQYSVKTNMYNTRFPDLEFYIDSWNYGAAARFMNHHCIGNAVLELNTAGYILVLASKNIEQNSFVEFNYNGSKDNKCCECRMLPFTVECAYK